MMVAGPQPRYPNFAHPLILTAFAEVEDQLAASFGVDLRALGAGPEDGIADQEQIASAAAAPPMALTGCRWAGPDTSCAP
jgi:hypothetical protein